MNLEYVVRLIQSDYASFRYGRLRSNDSQTTPLRRCREGVPTPSILAATEAKSSVSSSAPHEQALLRSQILIRPEPYRAGLRQAYAPSERLPPERLKLFASPIQACVLKYSMRGVCARACDVRSRSHERPLEP